MDLAKLEDLCAHKNIPIVGRYHALGDTLFAGLRRVLKIIVNKERIVMYLNNILSMELCIS